MADEDDGCDDEDELSDRLRKVRPAHLKGNAEEIGERDATRGARRAATETYQGDRRGREHRAAIDSAFLKKQVTVEDILAGEKVVDPLGAAPDAPFGFLHFRWVDFMSHFREGDELWTFEVPPADLDFSRRGYAIVRSGLPVASFVTDVLGVWATYDDETLAGLYG